MVIIVEKNTFPEYDRVPHAKQGDVVKWEAHRDCYRLIRFSDKKCLFAIPKLTRDGLLQNGQKPNLMGVIAEVKSKGYILELTYIS